MSFGKIDKTTEQPIANMWLGVIMFLLTGIAIVWFFLILVDVINKGG